MMTQRPPARPDDRLGQARSFLATLTTDEGGARRPGVLSVPYKISGRRGYTARHVPLDGTPGGGAHRVDAAGMLTSTWDSTAGHTIHVCGGQ